MPEHKYFEDGDRPDIPDGYEFFPAGDRYLTRNVKMHCEQLGVTYYTQMRKWRNHHNRVGYHAPIEVVAKAKQLRDDTALQRAAQKAKRLIDKEEVIEAAKKYLKGLGKDNQLAETMLDNEFVDELHRLLKACNGDRIVAKRIVQIIQKAQLDV